MPKAMKREDVKISCLVCTLTAPISIEKLLDSLLSQEWVRGDELILIDNGMSSDRRIQIEQRLKDFTKCGISAQCHQEPQRGVVHARIKSIQVSKNPWLFSLDDDNIVTPGALQQIRQRIFDYPTLGGLCPRLEPVWEVQPETWAVALGHQVLSYNVSQQHASPYQWCVWKPGVVGQRPPTGGMLIAKTVAEDFIRLCSQVPLILSFTPRTGQRLTGEDFILYSLIYMRKDLVTAYDDSIVVQHHIPERRTQLSYLIRTMFWSNYSFGIQGLMRFGKARVLYVMIRGIGRLLYEFVRQSADVISWRVVFGYLAGCLGFLYGVLAGLVDPECKRIHIDP
jgi:glycosyltransferase involved in cell wall biosynthesis